MKTHHVMSFFLLLLVLLLPACSAGGEKSPEGSATLIFANLTEGGVSRAAVNRFNRTHEDIQIEVRDYFDEGSISGKDRLLTEIAAGNVPDIIDMGAAGGLPYQQMARKGILENLWPYIENDPELGREGVVEAPLKAAEVDGGLYVIFDEVLIFTQAGAENVVGDRYSWTLEELLEAYAAMPEGSDILSYWSRKRDVFESLFCLSTENYVDWNTGKCFYDSEKFRSALEFINNNFPDEWSAEMEAMDTEELNAVSMERLLGGQQLLGYCLLYRPMQIQEEDIFHGLGGRAAFVGYPMEDGSVGSYFRITLGRNLAMSSTCQNKEAAWDFLREMLLPRYEDMESLNKANVDNDRLPLNRADYELLKRYDMSTAPSDHAPRYMGPILRYHKTTQEEVDRFEDFMNSIDKIDLYDRKLYEIAYEVASAYFAGDKSLDEAVMLIQQRAQLYVNESR